MICVLLNFCVSGKSFEKNILREHNADTPEKKGKLLLHINAAFISSSVSSSIRSITF